MLIGEGDISNVVIILGLCFSMCVYIRARFRFALIGRNLKVQSTGSHRELEVEFKFQRRSVQALLPFPDPRLERPGELARRLFFLWPSPRDLIPLSPKRESKALCWKYLNYEQDARRALTR